MAEWSALFRGSSRDSVSPKRIATGSSSIAGGGFTWAVYFVPSLRLLAVSTSRGSGYMKTSTAGSQSKKLCTLESKYRPTASVETSPFSDAELGHSMTIGIDKTGAITATVTSSKALASYGFPNAMAVFLV